MSIPIHRPTPRKWRPQHLCLDKGYDSREVLEVVEDYKFIPHIRKIGEPKVSIQKKAGFKPRRWVVEGTHSWMNRNRGVLIRWEKDPENYLALLQLVSAIIILRKVLR